MTAESHLERIVLAVADPVEAIATWQRTLGLPPAGGDAVEAGNTLLEMRRVDAGGREGLASLVIEVDDLEAVVRRLRSNGFEVSAESDSVTLDPAWTCGVEIALVERGARR
jgi:catechol 2,3-dioxygenase-like lactoylglutathione lyase family enzyme